MRLHTLNSSDFSLVPFTEFCAIDFYNRLTASILLNLSFWLFFFAPMLLLTILFIQIGLIIMRTGKEYSHGPIHNATVTQPTQPPVPILKNTTNTVTQNTLSIVIYAILQTNFSIF